MSSRIASGQLRAPSLAFAAALLVVLVAGLAASRRASPVPWPSRLRIATATEGGSYDVIGRGLAVVLAGDPERRVPHAVAERSNGSGENVERLVRGDTELALVSGAILRSAPPEQRAKIHTLCRLYDGYMQLVVRTDAGIETVADLRGKRVYVGKRKSGTETIAERILEAEGLDGAWVRTAADEGFADAARRLVDPVGALDAAIFGGGIPTAAVATALASPDCRLLGLGDTAQALAERNEGLVARTIPAGFYRGQTTPAPTIAAPALLVGRRDLPPELVARILGLLFDDVDGLLAYALHQPGRPGVVAIEAIGIQHAFPAAEGPYHEGSVRFQHEEEQKVLIATGALGGRYHRIGRQIQMLLEQAGLGARTLHTAGSFENARLLQASPRPTIGILQYDAALATFWGNPRLVYRPTDPTERLWLADDGARPPYVPGLRTIARLHEERMHILVRPEVVAEADPDAPLTVALLEGRRVCLGPTGSATQALAQAILHHHDVTPASRIWLPFRDMQLRLDPAEDRSERDLDAGFFCGGRPSLALQGLLGEDTGIRLLGIDPERVVQLTLATSAIEETRFESDGTSAYGCLSCDVPALATRAVLVTTLDNPHVETITRAVFQGAGVLPGMDEERQGIAGIEQSMAAPLAALLPHPEAIEVYEERGLRIGRDPRIIETLAGALGILAILVATYRGAQYLRQEQLAERFRGRVLEVSLAAKDTDSVRRLNEIRGDLRRHAQRRWWQGGVLSKKRWHELEAMLEERSAQARSLLSTAVLAEARAIGEGDDPDTRAKRHDLHRRVWEHAEHGELDELQVLLALRALGT